MNISSRLLAVVALSLLCNACASYTYRAPHSGREIDIPAFKQKSASTCAAACLFMVARYWGSTKTIKEIDHELGSPPRDGYTLGQLQQWARLNGFHAFVFSGSLEDIRHHTQKRRPLIVSLEKGKQRHSLVVKFVTSTGDIAVMDPAKGGKRTLKRDDFQSRWEPLGRPILLIAPARSAPQAATTPPG